MNPHVRTAMTALVSLSALASLSAPTWAQPWSTLTQVPLADFFPVKTTELSNAAPGSVVQLDILEARSLAFVVDKTGDAIHVLDAHYDNDPARHCVQTAIYPVLNRSPECKLCDSEGNCSPGVYISRGWFRPSGRQLLALALSEASLRAFVVSCDAGNLKLDIVDADALTESAADYLYVDTTSSNYLVDGSGSKIAAGTAVVAAADDGNQIVWLANDTDLFAFDSVDGAFLSSISMTAPAIDMVAPETGTIPELYVLNANGVRALRFVDPAIVMGGWVTAAGGQTVAGESITAGGDKIWVLDWSEKLSIATAYRGTAGTTSRWRPEVLDGVTEAGPISYDGTGERLYVATSSAIHAFDRYGNELDTESGFAHPLADISVTSTHEIVALDLGSTSAPAAPTIHVYYDEKSLVGKGMAPLALTTQIFIEHPRESDPVDAQDCRYIYANYSPNIRANTAILPTIPGQFALAVDPYAALSHSGANAAKGSCQSTTLGQDVVFSDLWSAARLEIGPLFHSSDYDCTTPPHIDPANYRSRLKDDVDAIAHNTETPTFFSGISDHYDASCDWVQNMQHSKVGAPDRYLFFGTSLLTEIPHQNNNVVTARAKDSYPIDTSMLTQVWRTNDWEEPEVDHGTGILMVPGDNIPVFHLSGCGNLFQRECLSLPGVAPGTTITPEDIDVLQLLIRRAIAVRDGTPANHWSFHWPNLARYDYTRGCVLGSGGLWSADDTCQAYLMQDFFFDIHRRFYLHTPRLIDWVAPSDL